MSAYRGKHKKQTIPYQHELSAVCGYPDGSLTLFFSSCLAASLIHAFVVSKNTVFEAILQANNIVQADSIEIGEIESGKRFPSVAMIERMAEALKVESYFLFQNEPHSSGASNALEKLTPSEKLKILHKANSALAKILDGY